MKVFILFLFVFTGQLFAKTFAQDIRLDLSVKDKTLIEVIDLIREESGLSFIYSAHDAEQVKGITVKIKNKPVGEILEILLKGTSLTYTFEDNLIILRKSSATFQDNLQNRRELRGVVLDKNKMPMPSVTVRLENATIGTITNTKGSFTLWVPSSKGVLEFSFIGYKNQKVNFTESTDTLRVVLEELVKEIDEVVVTGYQTVREKSMAGSHYKVKAEELMITGNETIEQLLQGKVPDMMVINTSGLTGTRQKVRVRGTSTLVGNAEPVWVVDGIIQEDPLPFESSVLTDIGDENVDIIRDFVGGAIAWLNPSDIEEITVLKDAAATAIYGVKAANGVIVITTRKGRVGSLSVGYSGNFSTSEKLNYKKMEIMNSQQRVDLSREAYERGARIQIEQIGYTPLAMAYQNREITYEEFNAAAKKLETVNTNWFDILYRTPFSQSHSINFGGGSNTLTARASFGYTYNQNTAKGNEQKIYRGNFNINAIFRERLTLAASLSGSHTETKAFAGGVNPFSYAINTSRVIACYDEEGDLYYYPKGARAYNILNELAQSGNENTSKSLNATLNFRWSVGRGLTLSSVLGLGSSSSFGQSWFSERSHRITTIRGYEFGEYTPLDRIFQYTPLPYGGMLSITESRNFNYTWRGQAELVKTLNRHSFNAMLGMETRSTQYDGYSQTNYGYLPDRGKSFVNVPVQTPQGELNPEYSRSNPTITDRLSNYFSYYLVASYLYDSRYALNISVRGDASNRFGQNRKSRYQPVWATGLRWNVTDEHWLNNSGLLNNLVLIASFGYQGNVAENIGPDLIAKMLPIDETTGEYQMAIVSLPSPDLKWEKTLSVNLGVNFSIFHNKLNGAFEYYHKKTIDLITRQEVPYENGVTSMYINGGDMKNSGWNLNFSVVPIRTKGFVWNLGFNTSRVYNKVNSNLEPTGQWREVTKGHFNKKGYPVSSFWAFRFTGLNSEHGGPEFDLSQANTNAAELDVTEYMVHVGKLDPDLTAGVNMSFRYHHLTLSTGFYLSMGNQTFLSSPYTSPYTMPSEYLNASSQLVKRWRKPGDETKTTIPSIPIGANCRVMEPFKNLETTLYPYDAWANSDIRVVDAWYLRCNNITLSYSLSEKHISRFAKNLSFTFTVTNPFQIVSKDFDSRDPEVAKGSQPLSRNFSFGLNASF